MARKNAKGSMPDPQRAREDANELYDARLVRWGDLMRHVIQFKQMVKAAASDGIISSCAALDIVEAAEEVETELVNNVGHVFKV